jgi:hypothetical protein
MSELRNQLDHARRAYVDARYSGDLAGDVALRQENSAFRWLAASAASSAIAAAVVLAWALYRGAPERSHVPYTLTIPTEHAQPISFAMPPKPEIPTGLSLTIPAPPPMPSLDALLEAEQTTSTTQEAV